MGLARGYIDRVSGTIVLNVAHSQVTAGQIADHELWHWKTDSIQRISGDRAAMIRVAEQRIREEYGNEELDAVLDKYIDGYGDVYDMNAPDFLDRVYEEIMADAYAGINAFGADAAKYRKTVNDAMTAEGLGREVWNAREQAEYAAPGGDQRVYTDEDAPPLPEDEDWSQVPEYEDEDPMRDHELDFSYGGENAKNADREALERAQRMEEQGFSKRDIFRDTGWFRGADGKWRFEIDDSGMKYHKMGDAQFSKDHPEYRRYRELELKFIEGNITDAEIAEMAELRSTWANEAPRLRRMVVQGNAKLQHVLAHDALFEQYPQLRDVRVRFGDTGNAGGYWDQERNEIVISNRYRHADPSFLELTLLHEIQHAIQDIEGFAGGSNPEYWEERQRGTNPIRENDAKIAKAEREAQAALEGIPPEIRKDFWYAANMWETDPEGAEKLENELFESEYSDAYGDYSWEVWTLKELLEQDNPKRTAKDLYRNTAGEIEARDAANRQHLDAGARKNRLPDTGDERTVFAEDGGRQYSAKMTEEELQAIQNIGRKSINQFDDSDIQATEKLARRYWGEMGVKSPFFRAWFGDWRMNDRSEVQVASVAGVTKNQPISNADTGWKINISGKIFDENKTHRSVSNRAATPYMQYLNDIVAKAVLLDSSGGKPKSQNTLLMHSMYAVADIGNGPEVLKLYVEEMNNPGKEETGKRAYNLQNIEKAFIASERVRGEASSPSTNTINAINTVADLFAAVKTFDAEFRPNPPSKVVNEDGTPRIMYHGTDADWNSYDLSKNVNQQWGEGIYLAKDLERARGYGDNVRAFYVNAKYDNRDAKRLGVQRDHIAMKQTGDILVFSPNQIKSADENIGTFSRENPDIRFSLDSEGREYTMQDIGALQQERYQLKEERNRLLMANPNYAKAVEERRYANTFQERIAASKALRAAEAEVDTAKIDARMAEIDDILLAQCDIRLTPHDILAAQA